MKFVFNLARMKIDDRFRESEEICQGGAATPAYPQTPFSGLHLSHQGKCNCLESKEDIVAP